MPQGMGAKTEAENAQVEPKQGGMGPVLLRIIEAKTLL
jgi:hypothetical protein